MKKVLFSILLIGALFGLAASVSADGFTEYSTFRNDDGTWTYDFECGLRVTMDEDWYNDTFVRAEGSKVTFFHKDSNSGLASAGYSGGGRLFSICTSPDKDYEIIPDYTDIGYREADGLYYYAVFPTDYQAYMRDDDVRARYDELFAEVYEIADAIELDGAAAPKEDRPEEHPEADEYKIEIDDMSAELIYERSEEHTSELQSRI